MIKQAREKGCYLEDIACQAGCSVSTVKRALSRQGPPPKRRPGIRPSKLDDFKPIIGALLADNVWNAEVIFAEIKDQGYTGGITILRDYIQPRRTLRESKATTRYETAPGHQLQHDWGELMVDVAGELRKVYVSVNVLGYSRRFYAWAAYSNDAEHTYESLARTFEWFGWHQRPGIGRQPEGCCPGAPWQRPGQVQRRLPANGAALWLPAPCLQALIGREPRARPNAWCVT